MKAFPAVGFFDVNNGNTFDTFSEIPLPQLTKLKEVVSCTTNYPSVTIGEQWTDDHEICFNATIDGIELSLWNVDAETYAHFFYAAKGYVEAVTHVRTIILDRIAPENSTSDEEPEIQYPQIETPNSGEFTPEQVIALKDIATKVTPIQTLRLGDNWLDDGIHFNIIINDIPMSFNNVLPLFFADVVYACKKGDVNAIQSIINYISTEVLYERP